MDKTSIIEHYKAAAAAFSDQVKGLRNQQRILSFLRLASFLGTAFMVYTAIDLSETTYSWYAAAVFFAIFLGLVKFATKLSRRISYLEARETLASREVEFLQTADSSAFADGGEHESAGHLYANDIDIFGRASLFQFINRTITVEGSKRLAEWLAGPTSTIAEVTSRQETVSELAGDLEWRHDFLATGKVEVSSRVETPSEENWKEWLSTPAKFTGKMWVKVARIVAPLISVILITAYLFNPGLLNMLILWALLQLGIVGRYLAVGNREHGAVSRKLEQLHQLETLADKTEQAGFKTPNFMALRKQLGEGKGSASREIKQLTRIANAFDARLNLPLALVLNALFLWDIQCLHLIEKWREDNRKHFTDWLNALGTLDAYCALANLRYNEPDFVYPTFEAPGSGKMSGKALGHPLLKAESRICNDFELNGKGHLAIITGANMAGKSTFLRTVGTNLVLAFAGAPVCATELLCSQIQLFSSMRTSDSLEAGKSYFHAELSRLQKMISLLRAGTPLFIMLDEMLKGTNSRDKQEGSIALTRQLTRLGATGLIATHDLALGALEDEFPGQVRNHCFEVFTEDDRMWFDYKLREGVCQNLNATYLMRQMGIMETESSGKI